MKLLCSASLAALALLLGTALADPCPTLRVTTRAPKAVRNNKLYTLTLAVKNTDTAAASGTAIALTLPAGVLYKSHTDFPPKSPATFAQNGQALTWSAINLAKKGAAHTIKLKVNVTNCADGALAFAASTTVGGVCPTTATPATATVKHPKGWVACPPSEICSIPTADSGIFACPTGMYPCGGPTITGTGYTAQSCAQYCLSTTLDYATFYPSGGGTCECFDADDVTGTENDNTFSGFALDQPRSPPQNSCGRRRLSEQ